MSRAFLRRASSQQRYLSSVGVANKRRLSWFRLPNSPVSYPVESEEGELLVKVAGRALREYSRIDNALTNYSLHASRDSTSELSSSLLIDDDLIAYESEPVIVKHRLPLTVSTIFDGTIFEVATGSVKTVGELLEQLMSVSPQMIHR